MPQQTSFRLDSIGFEGTLDALSEKIPNPVYPKENFDAFIVRMIEKKKKRVEIILDVLDLEL